MASDLPPKSITLKLFLSAAGILIGSGIVFGVLHQAGRMLLYLTAAACQSDDGLYLTLGVWTGLSVICGLVSTGLYLWKRTTRVAVLACIGSFAVFLIGYVLLFLVFFLSCA